MTTSTPRRKLPLPEIGTRYGQRVILDYEDGTVPAYCAVARARCDCGHVGTVRLRELERGRYLRCLPCSRKSDHSGLPPIGTRVGTRTIIDYDFRDTKRTRVFVQCDCGHLGGGVLSYLLNGKNQTCLSCAKSISTCDLSRKDGRGYAKHPLYNTWRSMWARTTNPKDVSYKSYGGAGIYVCERWRHFPTFVADMKDRPSAKHSLHRLNRFGWYSPENVVWADWITQASARSNVRLMEFEGEQLTASAWARKLGINVHRIYDRLNKGHSVEKILVELGATVCHPSSVSQGSP